MLAYPSLWQAAQDFSLRLGQEDYGPVVTLSAGYNSSV